MHHTHPMVWDGPPLEPAYMYIDIYIYICVCACASVYMHLLYVYINRIYAHTHLSLQHVSTSVMCFLIHSAYCTYLRELVQLPHNRSCVSVGAVMNCGERRGGCRLRKRSNATNKGILENQVVGIWAYWVNCRIWNLRGSESGSRTQL